MGANRFMPATMGVTARFVEQKCSAKPLQMRPFFPSTTGGPRREPSPP